MFLMCPGLRGGMSSVNEERISMLVTWDQPKSSLGDLISIAAYA